MSFAGALGHDLAARCDRPDSGEPVAWALFAHCFTCSKDLKAVGRISRALVERGLAVLRFDFTGLGESAGDFADTKIPRPQADNHYAQWTDAVVNDRQPSCPFSYSGPLTETVLLGNVAYRSGQTLIWNSQELLCEQPAAAAAQQMIRRRYRKGWEVKGL